MINLCIHILLVLFLWRTLTKTDTKKAMRTAVHLIKVLKKLALTENTSLSCSQPRNTQTFTVWGPFAWFQDPEEDKKPDVAMFGGR